MKFTPRTLKTITLFVAAAICAFLAGRKLPYLDRRADEYFTSSITKAGVAYGVCRAVNASVSVIKESHLEVEPAGVGLSLALGQVLDPIDDLVERASNVLITAIVSLGVQKLAYQIAIGLAPPILAILLGILGLLSLADFPRARPVGVLFSKTLIVIFVARICLPMSSLVNAFLDEKFFGPEISAARTQLSFGAPELEKLKTAAVPELGGVFGYVKETASDLRDALARFSKNTANIVENLLKLTWLYVAVFLVQAVILPITTFWALVKLVNTLFAADLPYLLNHGTRAQSASTYPQP